VWISCFVYFLRVYLLSRVGLHVGSLFFFILSVGAGQGLPLPGPSGPASSSSWREDSFGLQVLLESFDEKGTEESSVNQPPANPVASPEEAASPPHVVPYPYQPDEVIGVCSFYPAEALSQRPLSFCRGHTTGPNSSRRPIRGQGRDFQGHVWPWSRRRLAGTGSPGPRKFPHLHGRGVLGETLYPSWGSRKEGSQFRGLLSLSREGTPSKGWGRTLYHIAGWIARIVAMEIVYNNLNRTSLGWAYLHP